MRVPAVLLVAGCRRLSLFGMIVLILGMTAGQLNCLIV